MGRNEHLEYRGASRRVERLPLLFIRGVPRFGRVVQDGGRGGCGPEAADGTPGSETCKRHRYLPPSAPTTTESAEARNRRESWATENHPAIPIPQQDPAAVPIR